MYSADGSDDTVQLVEADGKFVAHALYVADGVLGRADLVYILGHMLMKIVKLPVERLIRFAYLLLKALVVGEDAVDGQRDRKSVV